MACRHLNIHFTETGDVDYNFFRHHSKTMLSRYLIEWPSDQVEILGGQCLKEHNFRTSVTAEGFLLLEWDKLLESETGLGRGVKYRKKGFLQRQTNEDKLWSYREKLGIKADFSLNLHSQFQPISAIKSRSSAIFRSGTGLVKAFLPRDLSEAVFHESGELEVDWVLETLEKSVE